MKLISLIIVLLSGFALNLMAVPAAPYLITFAQPDGSTFQAHLRGDENFSWIETENKQVLVKSKTSGFFEFALLQEDAEKNLMLVPSGIPVIQRGQSALRTDSDVPNVTRAQLGKIWQSRIAAKRNIKLIPAKNSP
ncbi:MAG: hypothetical protein MK515_06845 [SAR324 cluster bacterium]|jgi:hypothetical protein|nr:hypothetical protein [SAR324 cluster bacterium]MCH2266169.1 hypothetical protein [SAR324 cluster bacterium]